jgi:hypothetical protein
MQHFFAPPVIKNMKMDYITELMKAHNRHNAERIAKKIGKDAAEFKKIIELIYKAPPPIPQRASWLLAVINDWHPELLQPYLSKFIDTIEQFKVDGIKRNMMCVLARQTIPEELQGKAVDVCFRLLLSSDETVVVKTEAMQTLANITKGYPELKNELKMAIEDQLPKTTAAFHSRSRQILKKL